MEEHIVKTTLLGISLSLKIDADPEYFSRVIALIERRSSTVMKHMIETDPHRISVLTNILLADELLSSRSGSKTALDEEDASEEVDQLTQELIKLINNKIDD